MIRWVFSVVVIAVIFCAPLGTGNSSRAGGPDQKGYSKSYESQRCDYGHHHHSCLKDPPRATVAHAIAAPQTVAAQMSVVNPFASNRSDLNPNVLRALADLMEERRENTPQSSVNEPSQKGSSRNSLSPQATGRRDLETEVNRLEDKLNSLEASIEKLNESTTRMLKALTDNG
jgi:hypothetical protein